MCMNSKDPCKVTFVVFALFLPFSLFTLCAEDVKTEEKAPEAPQAAQENPAKTEIKERAKAENKVAPPAAQTSPPTPAPLANQEIPVMKKKWTPFQASLFYPVQIFSRQYSVYGVNMCLLYSRNQSVYGFDLNPIGVSESKDFAGFQINGLGLARNVNGFQIALVGNAAKDVKGFQIYVADMSDLDTESLNGVRLSCIGTPSAIEELNGVHFCTLFSICETMNGLQFATYHCGSETASGVQFGAGFNSAEEMCGLQMGLVNYSRYLSGFQIGLLNFAPENWLPFSIGINFGF